MHLGIAFSTDWLMVWWCITDFYKIKHWPKVKLTEWERLKVGMQRYHFFRSDPIRSRKFWVSPIPIRSDPSAGFFFFFFFINVEFLYFCVTLLCVKHNLLDNFILMKNNMKIYIGSVYIWSLHALCNINPIAQNTSGGGLGHIPDELDMCKCIWLLKPHMWILLLQNVKIINVWDRVIVYMTF